MKKSLLMLVIMTLALLILVDAGFAQTKPTVLGTWIGFAVVGDGNRVDITLVIEKGAAEYTGKISDSTGTVPETSLKNIVFKDNKLTFEFDMTEGTESMLIKIDLTLENETLKGAWFDPDGNSDIVELTLKK
ncbi:MAG: hypothetical protein NT147_06320 [Candidatus Aminicenantes bacterium]|nr:hypothetical protein [Candidatus Aminicenantes bacterium]